MKTKLVFMMLVGVVTAFCFSYRKAGHADVYVESYHGHIRDFRSSLVALLKVIGETDLNNDKDVEGLKVLIRVSRLKMKSVDFWLRYVEPIAYKKINGPLPVEWETEVFEKFEEPYKREGAGLTLAQMYLDEEEVSRDSLLSLIQSSVDATIPYAADSIAGQLTSYHHFFLCNRLYILNLAAIYTTGFECPEPEQIIPELLSMMTDVHDIYQSYNLSYPSQALPDDYLGLYNKALNFVKAQGFDFDSFDHFTFIRDYINPLFLQNQKLINQYRVVTRSLVDYALNKKEISIFDKGLYNGQNPKGIFLRVKDEQELAEIDRIGKLLFYDPILSANNMRSCASCHKPTEFFTDTVATSALHFNHKDVLQRNTPSLINAQYNHLIMADGKHISLQHQTRDVITNAMEMAGEEKEILRKVLSCDEYRKAFERFLKLTPQETEVTFDHIASAITVYYAKFSRYYAPFDEAMNRRRDIELSVKRGFNLFMGKAQCGTCHFTPQFNGVKPPYIGSEFEVLGVPRDTGFHQLSPDKGRYNVNPAKETMNAFRTGTIRNASRTKPYMHNGVFRSLEDVIDFYEAGGGAGRGLAVNNQTLSADSLKLSKRDKQDLIAFIRSLDEQIKFETPPARLPVSKTAALNRRKVGGVY